MDLQVYLSEAYPVLFERAIELFPEFAFEPLPLGRGYRSTNRLKIDGTEGDKVAGVYYYAEAIYGFKDYTRGFISIYNYLKQRDGLQHEQVLDLIARMSGKPIPGRERRPEDEAAHRQQLRKTDLLEEANTFFIHCLSHKDNEYARSNGAAELRHYLLHTRGYTTSVLRLPDSDFNAHLAHQKMELGYIPGQKQLYQHLNDHGFSTEEIREALVLPYGAGTSHILTIPYRNKLGMIRGFAFRTIQNHVNYKDAKYLYTVGLERGSLLFGLRKQRNQALTLVEGVLDALHAAAQGLDGVIALGGASITDGQVDEILANQPISITICLDNDRAGQAGTQRALEKFLPHSHRLQLYIAQLPETVKDLDELLAKQGLDATRQVLQNADSVAFYQHRRLLAEAAQLEAQNQGRLSDKDFDFMLRRIAETELELRNTLDVHRFRKLILQAFSDYLTSGEILAFKTEELREIEAKKRYLESLGKLHRQGNEALSRGNIEEIERLYTERFREIRLQSHTRKFEPLLIAPDEEALKELIANRPPSLDSGYVLDYPNQGQPLLLPHGAISFFCAPTSHGKTTMLINVALNVALRYPQQEFHFFSYEEAQEAIFLKALNAYVDMDLSENNPNSLEHYFRTNTLQSIFPPSEVDFLARKQQFFKELIASKRLHIHYVDYTSEELIEAIHYLKRQGNIGGIFVDYMQLLKQEDPKKLRLSRQEELKQICIDLKDCAVETGLPLVLGAQFNREVTNHFRLHATKIGEAGDIERIASVVVGMWNNDFEPVNMQLGEEMELDNLRLPNSIYIKLLKNRGGKVGGWSLLRYNGNRGKIYADAAGTQQPTGGTFVKF